MAELGLRRFFAKEVEGNLSKVQILNISLFIYMPQFDHFNFTLSFISFSGYFLLTIILIATVYLPMLHKHAKINELHYKELIAQNIILKKEAMLLREKKEQYILTELKKKYKFTFYKYIK